MLYLDLFDILVFLLLVWWPIFTWVMHFGYFFFFNFSFSSGFFDVYSNYIPQYTTALFCQKFSQNGIDSNL